MPPDQTDQGTQPPPAPQPSGRVAGRMGFMRDPRMGFRRGFVAVSKSGAGPSQLSPAAEALDRALYDDPYYRKTDRPSGNGRKRLIVAVVVAVLLLAAIASAIVIPTIKKNNPNGLFVNSKAAN